MGQTWSIIKSFYKQINISENDYVFISSAKPPEIPKFNDLSPRKSTNFNNKRSLAFQLLVHFE